MVFQNLSRKIPLRLILIFIFLAIGITITGTLYYSNQKDHIKQDKYNELSAIADLKVNQISKWREERLGDAAVIFANPFIVSHMQQWIDKERTAELKVKITTFLSSLINAYDYSSIFLFDPQGNVQLSVGRESAPLDNHVRKLISEALQTKKVVLSDLYQSDTSRNVKEAHLDLVVPLLTSRGREASPVGILLLRITPYRFLYPLIQTWPTPSRTGETLLVRRDGNDVLYLNELRHRKNTALSLRLPSNNLQLPAAVALRGQKGVVEGIDYRGVPVLAALRNIPETPWFLIAKVDSAEIYTPIRERAWIVTVIVSLFIAAAGASTIFFWQKQNIAERQRSEEALRKAFEEAKQRQSEITALLEGSRAVLQYHEFKDAARAIFDACKGLMGATGGYIALLSKDGLENEVVFLESGGLPCSVDPSLPMPIRGLRAEAYQTGRAVYHNDFSNCEWAQFMPGGHVRLENVLFAPMVMRGKAVGLLGIANKAGGFNENDARLASAFGELAAIALLNSRTLESLENSEERFRSVVQTATDAIITINSSGNILSWNEGAQTIFGYSSDEVIDKPFALLIPERFHHDQQRAFQQANSPSEKLQTEEKILEGVGMRKDGSELPLEITYSRWKTKEGPFFTDIIRDISDRKRAEEQLKQTMQELVRSNAELEQFACVASHDLQEPLRMVSSYAQLLGKRYQGRLDSEADLFIHYAVDGTKRMQQLIQDLLTYSRIGTSDTSLETVECDAVCHLAVKNLRVSIEEKGAVVTHDSLPTVIGDKTQITQLFQNLISNALKFHGENSPRVHISSEQKGNEWVFSVEDNGIGIAPEFSMRIFDIFQRLHSRDRYPGSGVGLSICKKIVERHGGRIWVESEPGNGSRFYFTIPANTLDTLP